MNFSVYSSLFTIEHWLPKVLNAVYISIMFSVACYIIVSEKDVPSSLPSPSTSPSFSSSLPPSPAPLFCIPLRSLARLCSSSN